VAKWRSFELEELLGGPIDSNGITEESLERLIRNRVVESDQLDFKGGSYGPSTRPAPTGPRWTEAQEFAKDVAAFANQRGGLLLLGVEDSGGVATALKPIVDVTPEREEQRLRHALLNHQAPLAECWFEWVEAGKGGYYIAIIVPPSRRSPHAVLGDQGDAKRPLRYPVRHGRDTIWLTEPEVAERYRRRQGAHQDEAQRVRDVVAEGSRMLQTATGIWLFVAVIPEATAEGSLDQSTVDSVDRWYAQHHPSSPTDHQLPAYGRPIPAPGRVTFTGSVRSSSDDETAIHEAYLELHVDGSAFGAAPVVPQPDEGGRETLVSDLTLVENSILLADVTSSWCSHQVGAWGTATTSIGLVEADQAGEGALSAPIMLAYDENGRLTRAHRTRSVRGHPRAETVIDLSNLDTVQQRLAVTYGLLAGLLQWFGLAEPAQLRRNGAVVARGFGLRRARQVVAWAEQGDVDVEGLRTHTHQQE